MGQSTCEFMHDLYSWRLKWWGSRIGLRHALLQASIWRDMASLVLQDASVCLVTCLSLDWYTGKTCRMRKKKNSTDIFWLYSFIVLAWLAYLLLLSFPRLVVAVLKAINFLCYIYFFLLPLKEFKYVDLPGRVRVPSLTPPAAASYDLLSRGKNSLSGSVSVLSGTEDHGRKLHPSPFQSQNPSTRAAASTGLPPSVAAAKNSGADC